MKSMFKNSLISSLIQFALFNLVVFAFPTLQGAQFAFNHTFWILYTIVTAAMAVQLVATWFVLQDDRKDRLFLHLPLIRICNRGTVAITLIGICALVVPAHMYVLRYAAAFVCLIISGLGAISAVMGISAAELVAQVDLEAAEKTAFIRKISAQARPLMVLAQNETHKAAAQKVYEALRYSEPASHEELSQTEAEIAVSLEVFSDAVRRQDGTVSQLAEDLLFQIAQRNALCKELKATDLSAEDRRNATLEIAGKQKIAAILVCLIVAVGCLFTLWMYPRVIMPAQQYHTAVKQMETSKYDEAAEAFAQLGQYKDAEQLKQQAHYLKATDLLMKGDPATARSIFLGLGSYSNSAEMILECDFKEASQLFVKGEYHQALAAFELIQEHESAPQKILECRYAIATDLLKDGNTQEAEIQLALLGDFQDAAELLKELRYEQAKDLLHENQFQEALAIFADLDGYKESDTYLNFIPENLPEEVEQRIYTRKILSKTGESITQTLIIQEGNKISLTQTGADGKESSVYKRSTGLWDGATHSLSIMGTQSPLLMIKFQGNIALVEGNITQNRSFSGYFEMEK